MGLKVRFGVLSLAAMLSAINLFAQTERGSITGSVTDPSGAAVPGANVVITHTATNTSVKVVATTTGDYNGPNLVPGAYRVEISAPGFKGFLQDGVVLTAAGTVRVDARLQIGQVTEIMEVTTDVVQIQTENAKVSTAVQNRMVDDLPLVVGGTMRSPFDLMTIIPQAKGSGSTMALGGGQAAAWDATLDGVSVGTNRAANADEIAYNAPSLEAITEFTVDTNGFKAEYGQAGGGVITFSSKSGTNQLHGSAYDFLRNEKLDARGFFPLTRSVYKQNDFGASLGGPVYFPKLYNGKNRAFFFVAYEGFRNRAGANANIQTVPTPEMFQGDFSRWVDASNRLLQIYDPATTRPNPAGSGFLRDPFTNNQIPTSRFSDLSRKVMTYGSVVKPNRPGIEAGGIAYVRQNYITTSGTILNPLDKGSARIDYIIRDSHRLGFFMNKSRYREEVGTGGPPGLPIPLWTGSQQEFNTDAYRLGYDWTISPRLLNHFSVGGNQFYKWNGSPNIGKNWKDKLCFKNVFDCNVNFPWVTFTEFNTWGGTGANGTVQPLWAIKDDLSYIRGSHTMKFGYAFQSQRAEGFGEHTISGEGDFSFLSTAVPGVTSFTSGSSFASFLLGEAISGGTETPRYAPQLYRYHGFYAQDDWHVSKRLTLNLGVRYEFTLPPINLFDQFSDFTPDRPNPAVNNYPGALRFAGFGQGRENRRSLVPGWYKAIGPRVGLAFSADSKTTMRAAFGRSFSKLTVVSGSGHYAGFIGMFKFYSPNNGVDPAFNWDAGLPFWPMPPLIDPSFQNNQNVEWWQPSDAARAPENLYWTYSIQRQLTSNMVLEVAYTATVGTHLQTALVNVNQTPTRYLNDFVARYGPAQALSLLRSDINSPLAREAGIPIPYPNFTDPKIQLNRTVNQALRPFPQYLTVDTGSIGNSDKSGHSAYHGLTIKAERRYSSGLTFQWNYAFSKIITDSDSYYTQGAAQDQYNRRIEKSIGAFDQTHALKLSTVYELPLGRGKKWLTGSGSRLLGGWRIGAIQTYFSGFPIALQRNNPLPLFNGATRPYVTSYDNWRPAIKGSKFDPSVDRFMDRSVFPSQPIAAFGNATRFNPKLRAFPRFNENISLAKSFSFTEGVRLDFRWEAFNLFNRTSFGTGSSNLDSNAFGVVSSQVNTPRQMQLALKLYW